MNRTDIVTAAAGGTLACLAVVASAAPADAMWRQPRGNEQGVAFFEDHGSAGGGGVRLHRSAPGGAPADEGLLLRRDPAGDRPLVEVPPVAPESSTAALSASDVAIGSAGALLAAGAGTMAFLTWRRRQHDDDLPHPVRH